MNPATSAPSAPSAPCTPLRDPAESPDTALPDLPIVSTLIWLLHHAKGKALALHSKHLASACNQRGHSVNERRVRELISEHYKPICRALGGILVADGGTGFWIAESADDLVTREALLYSLAESARCKHAIFVAMVNECGLLGVLPDRAAKPQRTHVAESLPAEHAETEAV